MDRTTIEISKKRKEQLQEARLEHESNYDETIDRLLNGHSSTFVTEDQAREIADEQIAERVLPEAQR